MLRTVTGFIVLIAAAPALLFPAAGTVAWPMGWGYAMVVIVGTVGTRLLVARRNPDTIRERARGLSVEGTAWWDRWLVAPVVLGPAIAMVVAGLDYRFGWSAVAPTGMRLGALLLAVGGYALGAWAMVENRFFVTGVRLQNERGHAVVRSGPYRFVRHPGYAASLLVTLLTPVILDSAWAFVPAGIGAAALVARTALEDRFLHARLEGYVEYGGTTRCRLIPGVW